MISPAPKKPSADKEFRLRLFTVVASFVLFVCMAVGLWYSISNTRKTSWDPVTLRGANGSVGVWAAFPVGNESLCAPGFHRGEKGCIAMHALPEPKVVLQARARRSLDFGPLMWILRKLRYSF